MPKIIDHEIRKKVIAEATLRVISEKGMKGATVRNIAKEAGVSIGALQHYFSTQTELLKYAMNLVIERVTERINHIAKQDIPPRKMVVQILLEIIPTNEETKTEMHVWFEFIVFARNKPDIFYIQSDGLLKNLNRFMNILEEKKILKKNLNKEVEAEKLYAIVDGLALHAMLDPDRLNKDLIITILTDHVDHLFQ